MKILAKRHPVDPDMVELYYWSCTDKPLLMGAVHQDTLLQITSNDQSEEEDPLEKGMALEIYRLTGD